MIRVSSLEQYSITGAEMMRFEFFYTNQIGILNRNYARWSDGCFNRHALHSMTAGQKMTRRIHVRADVRAGAKLRQVAGIAVCDLECLQAMEGSVAGPI